MQWKSDGRVDLKEVIWREGMDSVVLKGLREEVLGGLRGLGRRMTVRDREGDGEGGGERVRGVGGWLWFGDPLGKWEGGVGPAPYAVVSGAEGARPVFNVRILLGWEGERAVREEKRVRYNGGMVGLKEGQATVGVLRGLWTLMGFLSSKGEWNMLDELGGRRAGGRLC